MQKRSPQAEEYLELLVRYARQGRQPKVKGIAADLGISSASASEMLRKLSGKGFVRCERYGDIRLTGRGEQVGRSVLRKHHLIEKLLVLAGIHKEKAHGEACVLEHVLSDEAERGFRRAVAALERPHGRACGARRLLDLKRGESGVVALLDCGRGACRRLMDMGLTPGTKVTVVRRSTSVGPIEISVRSSTLALGRGLAEKIFVK